MNVTYGWRKWGFGSSFEIISCIEKEKDRHGGKENGILEGRKSLNISDNASAPHKLIVQL